MLRRTLIVAALAGLALAGCHRKPDPALLEASAATAQAFIDKTAKELAALEAMDQPDNIDALDSLGLLAGRRLVHTGHFPTAFDAGVVV